MNTRTLDMTRGNPTRLLLSFSVPMLIGNLFQQLYNLCDSVLVGKLVSADALAAVGATGSVTFLFFALCNGISSGGGILTSQAYGRRSDGDIRKSIMNTAYVMLILPTLVGLTAFLLAPALLTLLSTPENIFDDALIYTRTMCVGIVFVSVYNFASSMLRALGDSRTPLYFLIFSCFLNVVLDLVFILSFHLGVFGAAIATIISQFSSAVICLIYAVKKNPYFRISREERHPDLTCIKRILRLGIPLSLQFSLIAISCMAMQRTVNSFGATAIAAFTATSRIEQMLHLPYQTLSSALSTYSGQNWGAAQTGRVKEGYHKSLIMMALFTLVMVPVIQLFGTSLISLFVKAEESDVILMGGQALRITSLFYIFLGVIYVIRGVLNGLGDASFALLNGIVEVLGRFIVPILLCSISSIGVWGIWWSVGVVWFFSGFSAWLRCRSYRKKLGI